MSLTVWDIPRVTPTSSVHQMQALMCPKPVSHTLEKKNLIIKAQFHLTPVEGGLRHSPSVCVYMDVPKHVCDGCWEESLSGQCGSTLDVKVTIPATFPRNDSVPTFSESRRILQRRQRRRRGK